MATGEILVNPKRIDIAQGVEGFVEVGGTITYASTSRQIDAANFTISANMQIESSTIRKTSGTTLGDSFVTGNSWFSARQGFWINMNLGLLAAGRQGSLIAVLDDTGHSINIFAYSNNAADNWRYDVNVRNVRLATAQASSFNDNMALYSNGTTISVMRQHNTIWTTVFSFNVPTESKKFRFHFNIEKAGQSINYAQAGLEATSIAILSTDLELSISPTAILRLVGNRIGILAETIGHRVLTLIHPDLAKHAHVSINVSSLYIKPVGQECGGFAITGQIVQFESNGGNGGLLEVNTGTVLNGLRWQAGYDVGIATFLYRIGNVSASCTLRVVSKLSVEEVENGRYPDLAQGEQIQFTTSCENAVFSSPNYPSIITENGILVAPTDARNEVFGMKNVIVEVRACFQALIFELRIQALFPTPKFCGASPIDWTPTPNDFLPVREIMGGGTSQVKNKNKQGILTWTVNYNNLPYEMTEHCKCELLNNIKNCQAELSTAKRLDDFYLLVTFATPFSVIDYHDGLHRKFIRLTDFKRKHQRFDTEQSRSLALRYENGGFATRMLTTKQRLSTGQIVQLATPIQDELYWEVIEW